MMISFHSRAIEPGHRFGVVIQRSFSFDDSFLCIFLFLTVTCFWLMLTKPDARMVSFSYCKRVVVSLYGALFSSVWSYGVLVICWRYRNTLMHPSDPTGIEIVSLLITKNTSKSPIFPKLVLVNIVPKERWLLWLNLWITGLLCLRCLGVSPITKRVHFGKIFTGDPLSTITLFISFSRWCLK